MLGRRLTGESVSHARRDAVARKVVNSHSSLVDLTAVLRRPRTRIHFELGISSVETERRLRGSIGQVSSFLMSPTWGRREELIGRIDGGSFLVRVRHGYSNGLTRVFGGRVASTPRGSRVEGEFRTLWWVVLVLRIAWLLILLPTFVYLITVLGQGRHPSPSVLGPLLTLALLVCIEAVARRMGDRDEARIQEILKRLFADASIA
jgi:hypothetical protein